MRMAHLRSSFGWAQPPTEPTRGSGTGLQAHSKRSGTAAIPQHSSGPPPAVQVTPSVPCSVPAAEWISSQTQTATSDPSTSEERQTTNGRANGATMAMLWGTFVNIRFPRRCHHPRHSAVRQRHHPLRQSARPNRCSATSSTKALW